MSADPLPPSDDPKPDADPEKEQEDVLQEGQPPLPEGEEAPHREDTSTLPKATMPVELPPAPASPGDPVAQAEGSAEAVAPEELAAESIETPQQEQLPQQPAPIADPKPAGFSGWLKSLSLGEKLCCLLIVIGILVFALTVFLPALFDSSETEEMASVGDFPIKGKHVEVQSANTHWRPPVLEGPNADTVRTGTHHVPEVSLKLSGNASVRILFRNSQGQLVGDPVTHEVSGSQEVTAISTHGLMHAGGFAALQTGQDEPWSVELLEAAAGTEDADGYASLFKMIVSPVLK